VTVVGHPASAASSRLYQSTIVTFLLGSRLIACHVINQVPLARGLKMPDSKQVIAIVDDDELVRKSLGRLLRSAGYQAEAFASAEAFLESLSDRCPACLILDIKLPGLSGIDLYQELVVSKKQPPTIFISAHENELVRARDEAPNAAGYLLKPFDSEDLMLALRAAVNGNEISEETPI
jgi:FixJ family two-component response regulator